MNIKNAKFKEDISMIDEESTSEMSKIYTKSYLHHLFRTNEILGLRIATAHNLHFYIQLMRTMRVQIINGNFETWANSFLDRYEGEPL